MPDGEQIVLNTDLPIGVSQRGTRVSWSRSPLPRVLVMQPRDVLPANVLHERVDILCRRRAVVQVIGVLVHVQGQDRIASREPVRVIGRPLIDEPLVVSGIRQQHPPRAAAHGLTHGDELAPPPFDGTEVSHQASRSIRSGSSSAPSPSKYSSCRIIEFVAINSSRLRPLTRNTGAVANSSVASCAVIAFRRFTAPP